MSAGDRFIRLSLSGGSQNETRFPHSRRCREQQEASQSMTIQDALTTAVAGGYHVQGSDGGVTVYSGANSDFTLWTRTDNASSFIPTVSPAKNSLVYFISIAYIDHLVWRSHSEEAKRGPTSGPLITRNGGAMVSLLLPNAPSGLSRIAGWCWSGATPRSQPRTPVWCPFRRPCMGRPVPR